MTVAPDVIRPPRPGAEAHAAAATTEHTASASGGAAILVVPTVGLFVMVGAVAVVNEVNHWWALALAMLFALIATLFVTATVIHMLADSDQPAPAPSPRNGGIHVDHLT